MNEKYTSLEDLMNSPYIYDKYDFNKIKDKDYEWYQYKQYLTQINPYKEKEYTKIDLSEELIRKFMKNQDPKIEWRNALDKMPIGFIEKYLRKKKLANIKPEEE